MHQRAMQKNDPFPKCNTVKPVYNDHPRDPKVVTVVDRWSLFRGSFMLWKLKMVPQSGGRYSEVVISSGLTVQAALVICGGYV